MTNSYNEKGGRQDVTYSRRGEKEGRPRALRGREGGGEHACKCLKEKRKKKVLIAKKNTMQKRRLYTRRGLDKSCLSIPTEAALQLERGRQKKKGIIFSRAAR